jgi:hypothetical protein
MLWQLSIQVRSGQLRTFKVPREYLGEVKGAYKLNLMLFCEVHAEFWGFGVLAKFLSPPAFLWIIGEQKFWSEQTK